MRETLGFSQAYIAEECGILNANTWQSYEYDKAKPKFSLLTELKSRYGVSLDWLISGEGDMLASSSGFDWQLHTDIVVSVEKWLGDNNKILRADKKAELIKVLYNELSGQRSSTKQTQERVVHYLRLVA